MIKPCFKGKFIEALISVGTVYLFIFIGFIFKRVFKNEVNEKTIVLLNLYFLSPLLLFWGLTRAPVNSDLLISPLIYFIAIFITLFIAYFYGGKVFKKNQQDKSIFLATSLVGNTGNLGIPLGIALFGEQSVPYTSVINIANVFFLYIFSVYFLAGNKFDFLKSLKDIFKIPAIPVSIFALFFNFYGFKINDDFEKFFTMGAYSAIVIQLVIFGLFMAQLKIKTANWKLTLNIIFFKHLLLPLIGIIIILQFSIDPIVAAIIFLELAVPLAVNNINLTALYNCKPIDTTFVVLVSSVIFILLIYGYIFIANFLATL